MKRIALIFLSLVLFVVSVSAVSALTLDEHVNQNVPAMLDDANLNLQQFDKENMEKNWSTLICATDTKGMCTDPVTGQTAMNGPGLIPFATSSIAFLATNPPIQPREYIADVMQNFGVAQPAYAQGFGFSALTPILKVWKAFRNIAYFLLVIVFIVIGFMIMFRAQVNPQTVVTIQQALPKLVITLILITFSYAIAGFVVDMIYLSIYMITELFQAFGILSSAEDARDVVFGYSVLAIGFRMMIGTSEMAGQASNAVSNIITSAVGIPWWLDWLVDAVAYLIIAIAVIIALFRTLFMLVMSYINIILATIFAPIQLLLNALPNQNTFGSWIKGLIADAAVFPAVAIMLLIGAALVGDADDRLGIGDIGTDVGFGEGQGWVAPMINSSSAPATGPEAVVGIIGLGIIMLLPEAGKLVKGAFQVEDKGIGAMVGQNLGRGPGALGSVVKAPFKTAETAYRYGPAISKGAEFLKERRDARDLRRQGGTAPAAPGASANEPQAKAEPITTSNIPGPADPSSET